MKGAQQKVNSQNNIYMESNVSLYSFRIMFVFLLDICPVKFTQTYFQHTVFLRKIFEIKRVEVGHRLTIVRVKMKILKKKLKITEIHKIT